MTYPAAAGSRGGEAHPDGESLRRFAQGRLGRVEMARVERHVGGCDACGRALLAMPEDRLVGLLRRRDAARLLLAMSSAAVTALAGAGCSGEPEPFRPADPAKVREAVLRKREDTTRSPGLPPRRGAR